MVPVADLAFSDEQMRQFIANGYVTMKTGLGRAYHETIYDRIEEVVSKEGNPGNNILPRIPEIARVFDDEVVRSALSRVLGLDYFMHPHRHCHVNRAGQPAQGWHKDSYWGFMKVRHHRPWWAMIFYYPQDVTLENGPSSVVPGSQYYEDATLGAEEPGVPVLGEAGTVMLIQYDVWHRAAANASSKNRYMLKFQFVRTAPPIPSVHPTTPWRRPEHFEPTNDHDVVWGAMWDWTHGTRSRLCLAAEEVGALVDGLKAEESSERASAADRLGTLGSAAAEAVSHLSEALTDVHEPVRINAAYALSAIGPDAVPSLEAVFAENSELATRYAAMACAGLGSAGVPLLIDAIDRPEASNRDHVAHALGEIGPDAQASMPSMLEALEKGTEGVRRAVAESLGMMQRPVDDVVPALMRAMNDPDDQVRFSAALSLTRMGADAAESLPVLEQALRDENRYVRAYAVHALRRLDSHEAQTALIDHLMASRWCPITSADSTF